MTHTWDYRETILHRAKKVFNDDDYKAVLCAVWYMIDCENKSFLFAGRELGLSRQQALEMYNKAEKMRLEDWEFREKTNELLNE